MPTHTPAPAVLCKTESFNITNVVLDKAHQILATYPHLTLADAVDIIMIDLTGKPGGAMPRVML